LNRYRPVAGTRSTFSPTNPTAPAPPAPTAYRNAGLPRHRAAKAVPVRGKRVYAGQRGPARPGVVLNGRGRGGRRGTGGGAMGVVCGTAGRRVNRRASILMLGDAVPCVWSGGGLLAKGLAGASRWVG
jgi:hypothetical protein